MYTSGTTGSSKGAVLPNRAVFQFGYNHAKYLPLTPDDIYYSSLPFFHVISAHAGWAGNGPSQRGGWSSESASVPAPSGTRSERAVQLTPALAGAMAVILYKQEPTPADRDNPLRIAYSIPVPYDIRERFEERFGVQFKEAYGSSDGGTPVYTPVNNKPGSCGRLIEGWELKIVDDDEHQVPPGSVGEILTRSGEPYQTMLEYYHNPEADGRCPQKLLVPYGRQGVFWITTDTSIL